MTDYLYGLSLAQQTKGFLLALGFGFIMGIFYDIFRIIRLCISKGKFTTIIFDVLYCIFLCFCTFMFCLTVNEGDIRAYLLLGELIGFSVYYFSLGVIIFSFSEKIISIIKRVFKTTFNVISYPFRIAYKSLRKMLAKFFLKHRKNSKNLKNKSNFLLKVNKLMLYNLFVKKPHSATNDISSREEV